VIIIIQLQLLRGDLHWLAPETEPEKKKNKEWNYKQIPNEASGEGDDEPAQIRQLPSFSDGSESAESAGVQTMERGAITGDIFRSLFISYN